MTVPVSRKRRSNSPVDSLRHLTRWEWTAAAAVLAVTARLLYVAIPYLLGRPYALRNEVETAATALVVVVLIFRWIRSRRDDLAHPSTLGQLPTSTVFLWFLLALALYGRMLSIGFLSDDYVLIDRASRWRIGAVTTELFRPVPLAVWAVLIHAGMGASALHLLNVIVHGTNAFLLTRVVEPLVPGRLSTILAGGLLLAFPLAPEAVVWCSGIFDVLATAFVLGCVLISRGYDNGATIGQRGSLFAFGLAAMLSKETAAVVGVLVLLDAWARHARARALVVDAGMLIVAAAVLGAIRIAASDLVRAPLTKYALQRYLFAEFGSLAVPWHVDVIRSTSWLPIAYLLILTGLTLSFALAAGRIRAIRVVLMTLMWILVAGAPLATFFFVAPDLQGARYLYLPAVGWAILLVAMAAERHATDQSRLAARLVDSAVVALIAAGVVGVLRHQQPWRDAAALRDEVEAASKQDVRIASCSTVQLAALPDSVEGAYVFRNGATEALRRDVGIKATIAETHGPCAFQWEAGSHRFVRTR